MHNILFFKKIKSILGNFCKFFIKFFIKYTNKKISIYGPFKLLPDYIFANFKNWSSSHNDCFEKCIDLSKNKNCFIDIGAHIGLVTLPASFLMKRNSKIISFEPSIINYKILKKHLYLNKELINSEVVIENLIISNFSRENVTFFEDTNKSSGMNSLLNNKKNLFKVKRNQISLDDYCLKNNLLPDLIKIDVEGNELNVLKGAIKVIKKYKPTIILSVHPNQLIQFGSSSASLFKFINFLEYSVKDSNNNIIKDLNFGEYLLQPN